jgi:arylsulfatase A-like enzyme
MKKVFGLHKGFDFYDDALIGNINGRLASEVTSAALKWIETHREEEVFLFLNYFDPHSPYSAPEPFTYQFFDKGAPAPGTKLDDDDLGRLYDAEILYMDQSIGRLLKGFKELGLYDDTMFVVTADHGELLGEHGKWGHGTRLYQEEIHIPLFIKYPQGEVPATTKEEPVQLVDVFPLILERAGVPLPPEVQGGTPPDVGHPIVSEVYPLPFSSSEGDWRVLFDGELKFCWNSSGRHELYDLTNDPREARNLAGQDEERVKRMGHLLRAYLDSLPKPPDAGPPVELDEETRKALRSLGYVK